VVDKGEDIKRSMSLFETIVWFLARNVVGRYLLKPFRHRVIEKISTLVSVKEFEGHHFVENAYGYKPIAFSLLLNSKVPIDLSIKSVWCVFGCNYNAPIQQIFWSKGDELATNGIKPQIYDLKSLGEVSITLHFNPLLCSLPKSNNDWSLEGYIEFECLYGCFKKKFRCPGIKIPDTKWDDVRDSYKKFRSEVFGE